MKIKTLEIQGIARIKNSLLLEFHDGMNIICGINGTCKTTILECIAHLFANQNLGILKKNSSASSGKCMATTSKGIIQYVVNEFEPTKNDYLHFNSSNTRSLYFKTNRNFGYTSLAAVPKDIERSEFSAGRINDEGVSFSDFKGWFIHRFLYSHVLGSLASEQLANLKTAQECFNILDKSISFSKVKADSNDIMVNSQQGEIYFEYLSAGYKSCLYILLGIIKEIEFRFKTPKIAAKDFDGLILIDEVDLHLHPVWQSTIVVSLKKIFPSAQIIVTTHSPHIIQSANPQEVIPLVINENGDIAINKMDINEYGFQGWTVEEILEDVMGMENARSELYSKTIKAFDKALDVEDDNSAIENYRVLQKMLHPRSSLRKVLEIQMAGIDD